MQAIKQNSIFFLLFFCYLVLLGYYLYQHNLGDEILFLNNHHTPFMDLYFKNITHLGDGFFFGFVILLLLLFVSYYQALCAVIIFVISTLMVQIPKRWIFEDLVRPQKYFLGKYKLLIVDGVDIHHYNSFPSGHTGSAFALALFLTLITKNKKYSILYFALAFSVAFSRMYLIQHFLRDVYVGAIFGVLSSFVVFYVFTNYIKIDAKSKLNNSLFVK